MLQPRFEITDKMLRAIGSIEAGREAISILPLSTEWEEKFRLDALIREVYFNALMDGSDLPLSAIEKIVKEEPGRDETAAGVASRLSVVGREKDIQVSMNYRNALKYIDQLSRLGKKTGVQFGEKECFQIHSLLMEKILPSNLLGIYRLGQIRPGVEDEFGYAPLAVEVPYQMEDFWSFVGHLADEQIHPVLAAGTAVYEIMRVQPFTGGNEGVARLIGNLTLSVNGYNEKQFVSMAEGLAAEKMKTDDYNVYLELFCQALADEMEKVKERVRRLSFDGLKATETKQIALTERQLALLSELKMKEEMTIAEARRVLPMVSDDTILRDLAVLVNKKLVRKKGRTKGAKYILRN